VILPDISSVVAGEGAVRTHRALRASRRLRLVFRRPQ
jgi:hypothetical protein